MKALPLLIPLALASYGLCAEPFYLGLKAGQIEVDGTPVDTETGFRALAGYQLSESFALEVDLLTGEGEAFDLDLSLDTVGVYGVYRTPGRYYLLGRLGFLAKHIEVENIPSREQNNTRWSGSIGAGVRVPNEDWLLEAKYSRFDSDLDYIGVNLSTRF